MVMAWKRLGTVSIKNQSGFPQPTAGKVRELKRSEYFVVKGYSITGEAPKEFVRVFIPKKSWKTKPRHWPLFIAKTGQKWYPCESIIEHLNTRIGQALGLDMAETHLVLAKGQLRILSRYFLGQEEELIHGANIYMGYLSDEQFVNEVERQKQEVHFFTISSTREALKVVFPLHHEKLFHQFLRMLLLDAFIGCNDRHMYNWGIKRSLFGSEPKFAPIYDTARSLFWNESEFKLERIAKDEKTYKEFLERYCIKSKAKIGIENHGQVNHVALVKCLKEKDLISVEELKQFFSESNFNKVKDVIVKEFSPLLSELRIKYICDYLDVRMKSIHAVL